MAVSLPQDCLTAVVEVPHLAASKSAFVAWTGASDLMVWGDPLAGGDASHVQEPGGRVEEWLDGTAFNHEGCHLAVFGCGCSFFLADGASESKGYEYGMINMITIDSRL